jgi:probable rRNA maturation factor
MSSATEPKIIFESDDVIDGLADHAQLRKWISEVIGIENRRIERLAYFFVPDEVLLNMNKEFLDHDTFTDILTFPYSYDPIAADIYISYDRVAENAAVHNSAPEEELRRVIIHGVLHMCGWSDKTEEDNAAMRQRENQCLSVWTSV